MSYVRICEFARRVHGAASAEWFARDGSSEFVRIEREASGPPDPEPDREALSSWSGCCTRRFGQARRGSRVFLLKYPVPLDYLYEFDAWFFHEHMPILLEEATWYGCEFYRALGPSTHTFAAIHHLDAEAMQSPVRERSRATPWWKRLEKHDWFDKGFARAMLTPL
jgi:hypothetical protein